MNKIKIVLSDIDRNLLLFVVCCSVVFFLFGCKIQNNLGGSPTPRPNGIPVASGTPTPSGTSLPSGTPTPSSSPVASPPVVASLSSPFGFHHNADAAGYNYLKDLGVSWSRDGAYFIWTMIDGQKNGNFDFMYRGGANDIDRLSRTTPSNVNIVANICPFMPLQPSTSPSSATSRFANDQEKQIYKNFVKSTVLRYDPAPGGNMGCTLHEPDCYNSGDRNYPSQDFIKLQTSNPIKYWQVCNQFHDASPCADASYSCYDANGKAFAEVQQLTYDAIKSADNAAVVLLPGDSALGEYSAVFQYLSGSSIDIVDYHRFGTIGNYDPTVDFTSLKNSLSSNHFNLNKLKFWITETGTYAATNVVKSFPLDPDQPAQTEKQQAAEVVKRYFSALGAGIERVFWAWGIEDGFNCGCCNFDFTGLIWGDPNGPNLSSGSSCYVNDGPGLGAGVKKLGYHSYKRMVEKFTNSNTSGIQILKNSNGVYLYKLTNSQTGKSTWVAWNDNASSTSITVGLSANTQNVTTTEAVPNQSTGQAVSNYSSAFNTVQGSIQSGQYNLSLSGGGVPVYIEEGQ